LKHYVDICNLVDGDVSAEVNALDYDGMIKEGRISRFIDQIVVKLPMTKEGVMAAKYFLTKVLKRMYISFLCWRFTSRQSRRYLC
jgi:transaldolase